MAGTDKSYKVTLTQSNKEVIWTPKKGTILELCESVGVDPDFSCRTGTCTTCEAKLLKGTFEYETEPYQEPTNGNILICCSIPTSDIEIAL